MHPLVFRLIVAAALVAAGCLIGLGLGGHFAHPTTGLLVGCLGGLAVFLLQDSVRAARLLRWLRGALDRTAPRDAGLWGELGYRIERAVRQREQAIERESGRLAQFLSAIEASPNGVLLLDAQDQIEWCSRVAAEHFGLDPVRDLRQPVTNLVRSPAFVAYLQAGRFDEPLLLGTPGGARTLSLAIRPYGEGQRLLLSQDITERERTDAMRRDFVANVSHEIRTPLTVLAGFVETLSTLPLSDAERRRVLALMNQQTERMQALVADLLTLARLEGSPRPMADRWFDVAGLLAQVRADGLALSGGQHRIEVEGAADAEIAGDRAEWLSAVGNLVTNAVRYTPAGGHITLRFDWREGGGAEIVVRDDGIGIAREHLPRLTERFYRVDGSRSRETGGTGLGLSIVKHVVQRHGGEVEVESEPGRGSAFRLTLTAPRVRTSSPPAAPASQTQPAEVH